MDRDVSQGREPARILPFADVTPRIDARSLVVPGATVIGDADIEAYASVWFGAVVRADGETIAVGEESNVQDGAVLHADPGFPARLGRRVTVGHRAVVHGAVIGDRVLIGMGAVVLNGATVGDGSIIGAGAVVPEGMEIQRGALVLGVPGRVRRDITAEERERVESGVDHYRELAERYREILVARP